MWLMINLISAYWISIEVITCYVQKQTLVEGVTTAHIKSK